MSTSEDPLQQFALYPFDTDAAYKKGLESILTGAAEASSKDELELRARVFYFNRLTGHSIAVEHARQVTFRSSKEKAVINDPDEKTPSDLLNVEVPLPSSQSSSRSEDDEARILTFAEIQELISSGRMAEIPNNKVIPDGLNDATPGMSTAPVREKPWERVTTGTEVEGDTLAEPLIGEI